MNNRSLALILVLIIGIHRIQTQDETENKMNTTEYDLNFKRSAKEIDDSFTAGNTMCRPDNKCGYHNGTTYSWCYTDYSENWDYCCTERCQYDFKSYLWCRSGDQWEYCGGGQKEDIKGRKCLDTHRCGMHFEDGENTFYWCYVDLAGNWGKCCAPYSSCMKRGESFYWCYISRYTDDDDWEYCKPW